MPPSTASAMAKTAEPPLVPTTDLVSSLPAPIVRLLVLLARPIAWLRIATEVLLWKTGRRVESWMVIGAWWGICLGAGHAFKYLLPVAFFLPLLPLDRLRLPHVSARLGKPPPQESTPSQPSTQDTLLHTLSDLHAIYVILPASPTSRLEGLYTRLGGLGQTRLIRGFIILWSTWLALGWVVGYRSLLALIGILILLLPSPTLAQLIHLLSQSLIVRRSVALLFLVTFGSPPEQRIDLELSFSVTNWVKGKWAASRRPSLALAFRPKVEAVPEKAAVVDKHDEEQVGEPIYFKFEVHENQRWWMGLDWTSALLPQERPSWCDSHLLPASPPQSFPLPPSSSIILPSPTPNDPESKVKRTATWKWLDDDWYIVRAGPGNTASPSLLSQSGTVSHTSAHTDGYTVPQSPVKSISSASTAHHADEANLGPTARAQSIAEHAFAKGLERLKARTTAAPASPGAKVGSPRGSAELTRGRSESQASDELHPIAEGLPGVAVPTVTGETICEKDDATDGDGWVYGDNKWESTGPKGGLGRFTRRRRWQRRAVCTETVERIPSSSAGSPPMNDVPSEKPAIITPAAALSSLKARPTLSTEAEIATARRPSSLSPTRDRRPSSSASVDRVSLGERDAAGTAVGSPGGTGRDDMLRQRLKKAMGNVGG